MVVINYNDKRPIYEQVIEQFQTLILNGVLEADEKLPSVRTLAMELSINPNTIQRAYRELELSGFIYTVKGRGNFVRANDALVESRKLSMLGELEKQFVACKSAGVSKEDIEKRLELVFSKRGGKEND